jgi:pilus assembly protein Flp/PilA
MPLPDSLLRNSRGVTAVEYGLLVALIAIVMIVALAATGTSLSNVLTNASNNMKAS